MRWTCLLFLLMLFGACGNRHQATDAVHRDLEQIKDSGCLVVLTLNSSTSYFHYRGEEMGYQYELAQQFAKELGLSLKVKVGVSTQELVDRLMQGEADLIALNLPIRNDWKDSLIFCGEEMINHQVLVQRTGKNALKNVTELIGKEVYVRPGKHLERLVNLDKELGGGILIHEVPVDSVSNEDLIEWVAAGKIDYTIANDDLAKLNKTYYPRLDVKLAVSFDQRSSWAVRKTSPHLAEAADTWHKQNMSSPAFLASARRYFEMNKYTHSHGSILSLKDGKISLYDHLFKKYAPEIGWDWRMLASLAYTESNFNPDVVSWAGAKGLMQLMPGTARAMGVPKGMEADPEESVKAAVKYLKQVDKIFTKVSDSEERVKFVLAAYNAGVGHVMDAMSLAEKYGHEKYVWDNEVAHFILLKNNEEYYNDPVCKHGYFRGGETFRFVNEVINRARVYKEKIKG